MVKRKVTISDDAIEELAAVAFFIEGKGLPKTASDFVVDAYIFFNSLSDIRVLFKPCLQPYWQEKGYRCVSFRKKYAVAFIDLPTEIIIVDFALQKLADLSIEKRRKNRK